MPKIDSLCFSCVHCGRTIGCASCNVDTARFVKVSDIFDKKKVNCAKKEYLQREYIDYVLWCDSYSADI